MLRLFLGIPLPPQQALALSAICVGLRGVRWVDPGNFHVTIRFIGEIDEGTAADLDAEVANLRAPAFSLSVAGVDHFGPAEKPRALIATLDREPGLFHLFDKLGMVMARIGLPPDRRRFTPHVTLAYCTTPEPGEIQSFIRAHNLLRLDPFAVDRFHLIRSYVTKAGSFYEDIASYRLS
jgi:RNA 2',3'-cyclic 3'-phosphodiesterase